MNSWVRVSPPISRTLARPPRLTYDKQFNRGSTMKALVLLFLVSLCPTLGAQVLVTVGKSSITVDEFNRRLAEARKQGANPPTREEFLEDIIRLELAVQEAEKMKLQDDPTVRDQIKFLLYE